MDGTNALTTIAELALGFAGFSGVVVVLGRQPADFTRVDKGRLVVLLMSSLGAMFFALLPFALSPSGVGDSSVWRISGGLLAVFAVCIMVFSYVQLRRVRSEAPEIYSWGARTFAYSVLLAVVFLQLAGAAKGGPLALSFFIFGLLGLLSVAALQFVRILFVRPR